MGGDSTDAVRYLGAADAVPIAITERDGAAHLTTGRIVADASSSTYWVHADQAGDLARQTRLLAGDQPSISRLIVALREAAASRHVSLTPHAVAIERAAMAAGDIDRAFDQLKQGRLLQNFNRAYRAHRVAAKRDGHGFMPYRVALERLKRVVARILASGQDPETARINFRTILQPGPARAPRQKPTLPPSSWF
jgi:hypothetical protein